MKLKMERNRILNLLSLSEVNLDNLLEGESAKRIYSDIFNNIEDFPLKEDSQLDQEDLNLEKIEIHIRDKLSGLNPSRVITYCFIGESTVDGIKIHLGLFLENISNFVKLLTINGYVNEFVIAEDNGEPVIALEITEYKSRMLRFDEKLS